MTVTRSEWETIRKDVDVLKETMNQGLGAVRAIVWIIGTQLIAFVGFGGIALTHYFSKI